MNAESVFVDTNLFLRYLTDDVPAQANKVESLFRRAEQGQVRLATTSLVIAEIVWTLESYYHVPKVDIQDKVLAILGTPGLDVDGSDLILQAVAWYAAKNVDFIDAYNAAWMLKHDVRRAATFDQIHFHRFEGLMVEEPG